MGDRSLGKGSRIHKSQGFSCFDRRELVAKNATPRCSLLVINLDSGDIVHSLRIEGVIEELYDVVILPNIRRPMAIGFRSEEIRRMIVLE